MGTSLRQLIYDIADANQDLVEATATANSGGNDTFTSSVDLLEDDDFYRGGEAYFLTGANAGLSRRIYGSDFATQTITVIPGLAANIQVGDQVELYNRRGWGRTRAEYKRIINRVLREASGNFMEPVVALQAGVFGGAEYLPVTGIDSICVVEFFDSIQSRFIPIRRAVRPGSKGWWTNGDGTISFSEDWRQVLVGYQLQFRGYVEPSALVLDTDETAADPEWIVETAAGIAQMSNQDNQGNIGPGQYMRNRADAVRAKMVTTQAPNCVRVR